MTTTRLASFLRLCLLAALLAGLTLQPQFPVYAAANLTVTPITWNVIGLDSNNVNVGPNHFPIGARVCNTGDTPATNVTASFVWDSVNTYINNRPGTLTTLSVPSLSNVAPNNCTDFYFEVEVTRNSAAYDTTRNYHIQVTADGGLSASTPTPRALYVEHLVSQSRNAVTDIRYGTTLADLALPASSVAPGGTMSLMVGNVYYIRLIGFTATQGYEQLESFINIPNVIFQTLSVATTYTADTSATVSSPNDKAYGDACTWENDPNSPNYRSCLSTGKVGGNITVTYQVRILQVPGAPLVNPAPLSTLIYDFSGSSFHYNADYDVSTRFANIVNASITKSFSPKTITPGQTSTLTFTVNNPGPAALTGVNFTDTLPAGMTLANTTVTYTGCGAALPATLTVNGPPQSLAFSNITVAGLGRCTVAVNVTANADATYNNTSGSLFINSTTNTGSIATDSLVVSSQPPAPSTCTTRTPMATWTMPTTGQGSGGPPPPYTTLGVNVSTATASAALTAAGSQSIIAGGVTTNAWNITDAWSNVAAAPGVAAGPYFQFSVDSSNYGGIQISAQYDLEAPGDWAANNNNNVYIYSSSDGTNFTLASTTPATKGSWQPAAVATTTITGVATTWFRITAATRGNQPTASMRLDNITISGCPRPVVPTLSKAFAPATTPQGSNSTLTFTLANPNATALTGVGFTDTLPTGLVIATPNGLTTTCTAGTLTGAPTATSGSSLISLSGATLSANANCTISVSVRGNVAGQYTNISGSITSAETGPNTTGTGYGTSSLTVVAPPVINKSFTANPIFTGNSTALTFTINNPNTATSLTGVNFTDTLPGGLIVATPNGLSGTCGGGTITAAAGTGAISLAGATLTAGQTCTFSVNVTGTTTGLKNNSVTVSSTNGGTGNTDTASVLVKDPAPAISLLKQVGPTASGPWTSFLGVTLPANVYYRLVVENVGDLPLNSVTVTDPTVSPAGCAWVDGDGTSLTAPFTLPVANANDDQVAACVLGPVTAVSGSNPNTATASGTNGVTVTDTSTATYGTTALTLVKSVTQTSFTAAGDILNYSYLVTNSGFAPLPGPVTVTDDKVTVTCPAVTTVGDNDTWFDVGEQVTCTAAYTVQPSDVAAGFVTNTASAAAGGVTSNTDSETVNAPSDLTVSKTNNVSGSVAQNGTFNWTITVSNIGTGAASFADGAVILSDPLPGADGYYPQGALTVTPGTTPPTGTINCSITGSALSCAASGAATLPAGASFGVTFAVTPTAAGTLSNTATVDPNGNVTETDETNNTALDSVTVVAPPSIAKAFSPNPIAVGGTSTLTFTVTNPNAATALTGVGFTDTLPSGLQVAATPNATVSAGCGSPAFAPSAADTSLTFSGGTIPASGTCTVTVDITGTTAGTMRNTTGAVTSANGGTGNTASADITITPVADLSVTKTDGSDSYTPPGTVTYTVTVTNNGPSDVAGASFSDDIPAQVTEWTWTCVPGAGASCTAGPTTSSTDVTDTITIPSGSSVTYTVVATVGSSATGDLVNTATVTVPTGVNDPVPGNNSSTDTNTFAGVPAHTTVKTETSTGPYAVGETITYTIVVANTGNVTLTGVTASDDSAVLGTCTPAQPATLAPGASMTCPASHVVTQADVDAGSYVNTATGDTDQTMPSTSTVTVNFNQTPALTLTKTAVPTTVTAVDDVVTYSFSVQNTGNVTLTNLTLSDSLLSGLNCTAIASLAPNATQSFTCTGNTYTVTQADIDTNGGGDGDLDNTATVTGTALGGGTVTDTDSATVTLPVQTPALTLTKTASPTTVTAVGDVVTYTFSVQNAGNVTLTDITLTDSLLTGLNCTAIASLAPNATQSFTCTGNTYTVTQADIDTNGGGDGDLDNTATVTGTAPGGGTVTDTDSQAVTLPAPAPALTLTKTAAPATVTAVGDVVTYTFSVQNTGNVTLTNVTIADNLLTGLNCTAIVSLAPNATQSFTCTGNTYTVAQADIDTNGGGDGGLDNTATATATTPSGGTVTETDSQAVTLPAPAPALTLTKTAAPTTVTAVDDVITYSFSVQNTGNVTLTNVTLSDSLLSGLNCTTIASLAPNATQSFTCTGNTYTVTQADIDTNGGGDGDLDNTATATATTPGGGTVTDTDSQAVTLPAQAPALTLTKTASPTTVTAVGDVVTYTFSVQNTGNVTLTNVTIADNLLAGLNCTAITSLAPNATQSFTCTGNTYTVTQTDIDTSGGGDGDIDNTATVTGTTPGGGTVTDTDSQVVTLPAQAPALTLTKTASPTTVTAVDDVVTYSFSVQNTGNVTLTDVTLTDSLLTGLNCTAIASLAPNATQSFTCTGNTYTVTQTDIDTNGGGDGDLDNTATVTGTTPGGGTVADTDSQAVTLPAPAPALTLTKTASPTTVTATGDVVTYTFSVQNTGNVTLTNLTLSDSLLSGLNCTAIASLAPNATQSFTCTGNTYTVTQADIDTNGGGDGDIDNTATVTGTAPGGGAVTDTDSQAVTLPAQNPVHTTTKTETSTGPYAVGETVTYTIVVTNTGNITLTGVTASDDSAVLGTCTPVQPATLAPGAGMTCPASHEVTQADVDAGSYVNTATGDTDQTTPTTSTVTVTFNQTPALTLTKTAAPTTVTAVGDLIAYTFSVQNTGNVTLTNLTLSDSLLSGLNCTAIASLAPNATQSFTCTGNTYTVTQADIDTNGGGDGDLDNTATVTGTAPGGGTVTDTDSQTVTLPAQNPSHTTVKTETSTGPYAVGETVTYTIVVANTGNVTLTGVTAADSSATLGTCTPAQPATLVPGASMTCPASHVVTQADVDAGSYVNTATGDTDQTTPSTSTVTVTFAQNPAINIVKTPPTQTILSGDTANFTLTVTNVGNVTLSGVTVTDAQCTTGPTYTGGDTNNDSLLQLTETWTYSCSVSNVTANFTNTASVSTTQGATDNDSADVVVTILEADLSLSKSVSNTSPLVATNIDFTLSVTNSGPDTATGVQVTDVIPSGFAYVSHAASQGTYNSGTGVWNVGTLVINQTETLTITVSVNVTGSYTNYAEITASDVVDPDSTPNNGSTNEDDDASVTVTPTQNNPTLGKGVSNSNQAFTTNPNVAVGEIVEYSVTVNVPPGVFANAQLVDTMERGLSFMTCSSIIASNAALTTDVAGSFAGACSTPTVDDAGGGTTVDAGRRVTFSLGTLTNASAADQTLTFVYTAVVLDSAGNVSGAALDNSAVWTSNSGTQPASSASVVVIEPDLSITKTANTALVSVGAEFTITLTIQHTAASETNAYDTLLTDALPAELELVPGTLECVSGAQNANVCNYDAGTRTVSAVWNTFTRGAGDGRVTFRVRVLSVPSSGVSNTASVAWTSLPGDVSTPQNSNVFSTERDYDPASQIDVYGRSTTLTIGVFSSTPATGFAPNVLTDLRNTPKEIYAQTGGVRVEIPSLGVSLPIVGVPLKNGEWNVSWLGNQAGWLEGSAFPSWSGNSVLTGHVYGSNGLPGPFVNLNKLKYGDRIIIHAYGAKYIYEVRANTVVEPDDASIFRHEEKAWLTLVTCKEYDAKTNTYKKRVVVRAVLVGVER